MTISIKKPAICDYKEIANLINNANKKYKEIHSDELFKAIGYGELESVTSIEDDEKKREILGLYLNNKIIGYGSFYLKNSQTVWISRLYVDPNYQRQGFGMKIIEKIKNISKSYKAKVLVLETDKKAYWAVDFYKKMGFFILSDKDLKIFPFDLVLNKPQAKTRYIFGMIL